MTESQEQTAPTTDPSAEANPLWLQGRAAVVTAALAEHWRGETPNYHLTDEVVPRERTQHHAAGSLEQIVEDLVRVFEMEVSHKNDPTTWVSMVADQFRTRVNGGAWASSQDLVEQGSYNVLIGESPYYSKDHSFESSHDTFHAALPGGFFWEVLEVFSGPPSISFSWRHWGKFTGDYHGVVPTGELVEMFGMSVARVSDDLKLLEVDHYYDSSQLLSPLAGGCPVTGVTNGH
ncbi:hypothetical protein [Luteipulveratus flavus]|uniref:SnoaL-like polyketide cyclase n=1 Tax=Luteipulveratus flavus TaxID=3031728 RepID=A0ABT6CB72_9MICO|nr:hypothetical protein [Luteipulveratus sp. YIM 133296]MDF8266001.1 hypothetical protein [Luteipulveratus sp. YIM 133296]